MPIGLSPVIFEPDGFTSLLPLGPGMWVRADLGITLTSGKVSNWADQSGNSRDATQPTAGLRPSPSAVTIGGQTTIDFTTGLLSGYSSATMINATSWPNGPLRTVFTVAKFVGTQSADGRFVDTGGSFSTDYFLGCQDSGATMCLIVNENSSGAPRVNGGSDSGSHVTNFAINNTISILLQDYVQVGTRTTLSPISSSNTGRGFGDTKATGFGALFHLAEFAEWDRVLSSAELNLLNAYAHARYGI